MIGLICGGGDYPKLIARACAENGEKFCLLRINGFCSNFDLDGENVPSISADFGEIQKMLDFFRANGVRKIALAGHVKRPNFNQLFMDKKALSWMLKLGKSIFKGDDSLLRAVIELLQEEGFEVISGTDLLKNVFLSEGTYSKISPTETELSDIKFGFLQAKMLGAEDAGQGVIVYNGQIIAKEDASGTDELIRRAGEVRGTASGGMLVKVPKPQQDFRVDLPAVGPQTIEQLHKYGFSGLAVEAEKCIVIDREKMTELADKYGMFFVCQSAEKLKKIKIFISAGEASGDYLGGALMQSIRALLPHGGVEFFGIGGTDMCAAGLKLLFPISELSIIGIWEVVSKIFHVKKLIDKTVKAVLEYNPDVVVTIDSSGFNHRVGRRLKKHGFKNPIVHYVAPPVWAWRKWRVKTLHRFIDKLLVLLPFEKNIFEKYGVKTEFVGHPVAADEDFNPPEPPHLQNFKKVHKLGGNDLVITLLPGSRQSELSQHMPILQEYVRLMKEKHSDLKIIIPTLPGFRERMLELTADWAVKPVILAAKSEKVLGYYASKMAVAASGTVTLELARAGLPAVVIYRTSYITYRVVKFLIHVAHVCLVNIIEEREAVPELLQDDCTPENIVKKSEMLLDGVFAEKQKKYYADVMEKLRMDRLQAGREVLSEISK